jgi:GNAT superfamily N-acetyltransferase
VTRTPSLAAHLAAWLGSWPPELPLDVIGEPARTRPGWDGEVHRVVGVHDPEQGAVLSVPPEAVEPIELLGGLGPEVFAQPAWCQAVGQALGVPGHHLGVGVFRAVDDTAAIADLDPIGDWVPRTDARVPAWLRPFNAPEVLLASDEAGRYAGGVGLKLHDPYGAEVAVVVEPAQRGRGLARRLVATAARRVLAEGRVATYLHDPANVASARVADAAGLVDRGWQVVGLFPPDA